MKEACRAPSSLCRGEGKLAYYEAFGFADPAAKRPMSKDAIFALASMTKPMVAVATFMLAEEGRLLLNDPVSNYLPVLKDMRVAHRYRDRAGATAADTCRTCCVTPPA